MIAGIACMGSWCIDVAEACIDNCCIDAGDVRGAHFGQRSRKFFSKV